MASYQDLTHDYHGAEPLPDTVKILHKVYKLKVREPNYGDMKMGEIDFIKGEINYVPLLGSESADTILHEVLHGLFAAFYLGDPEDPEQEEHTVSVIATGLITVMRDNPKLFKALQDMVEY